LVSASTSSTLRMSSSFPVRVAVPSTSNLTKPGFVFSCRPKPIMTSWLLRSFSSSFALALKLTVLTSLLTASLFPIRLVISILIETLGTSEAGQMVDSSQ